MVLDPVHCNPIMGPGPVMGMITPPAAINLYVAGTITGLPLERISRAVLPMLPRLILLLLAATCIPLFFAGIV